MIDASMQFRIQALPSAGLISSRIASTENVRVELLQCKTEAAVQWRTPRPEFSLIWVRDKGSNARVSVAGHPADSVAPGRARFWFFPEGIDAQGELIGKGAWDCAAVFVDPSFLPPTAQQTLAKPIVGFSHKALGRAFNELMGELAEPNEPLPLFTEGWAIQAFAYVARAAGSAHSSRLTCALAPSQLRRAKEMFLANLSEDLSLRCVAAACKLSVNHFSRAFKAATGVSPHRWLVAARIEMARDLLARSPTRLAEIAVACGFTDQSHFSQVFGRFMGTSPGVWRRQQWA